jgi:D-sedoheptulose 7-phosphate isomerase
MNNNKALSDLYPFLNENKKGVNTELLLASIQEKVADSINAKQAFFQKNEHKILRSTY